MKNNHNEVEAYIRKALAACNYDSALAETKRYLAHALKQIELVSRKRTKNQNNQRANEKLEQEKKTKHQEWWDMVRKNAADFDWDLE